MLLRTSFSFLYAIGTDFSLPILLGGSLDMLGVDIPLTNWWDFFLNPNFPSWNKCYVLVPRQKNGKGRQWGSSDLPRVTQLGSV